MKRFNVFVLTLLAAGASCVAESIKRAVDDEPLPSSWILKLEDAVARGEIIVEATLVDIGDTDALQAGQASFDNAKFKVTKIFKGGDIRIGNLLISRLVISVKPPWIPKNGENYIVFMVTLHDNIKQVVKILRANSQNERRVNAAVAGAR